jgi:hypothetical protein
MDVNMQKWLGVSNSTAGRASVVPQSNTEIDLDMGEYEWLQILHYLTSGENLQQAVANANNDVAHIMLLGMPPSTVLRNRFSRRPGR